MIDFKQISAVSIYLQFCRSWYSIVCIWFLTCVHTTRSRLVHRKILICCSCVCNDIQNLFSTFQIITIVCLFWHFLNKFMYLFNMLLHNSCLWWRNRQQGLIIFSIFHNVTNSHFSRRPCKVLFRAHFMWLAKIAVAILCKFEYYIRQCNKPLQKSVTEPEKAWTEVYTYTNNNVMSIWDCADGIRTHVSTLPVCLLARTVATHCDEQEQGGSHHKPSIRWL